MSQNSHAKKVEKPIEHIRQGVQGLVEEGKGEATKFKNNAVETAFEMAEQAQVAVQDKASDIQKRITQYSKKAVKYAKANPGTAIAAAVGLGLILRLISRRK